jgi:hypothetical protein
VGAGYGCIVARGWAQAWQAIKGYLDSREIGMLPGEEWAW